MSKGWAMFRFCSQTAPVFERTSREDVCRWSSLGGGSEDCEWHEVGGHTFSHACILSWAPRQNDALAGAQALQGSSTSQRRACKRGQPPRANYPSSALPRPGPPMLAISPNVTSTREGGMTAGKVTHVNFL